MSNPILDSIAGDFNLDKRYIQLVEKTNTYYPNAYNGAKFYHTLRHLEAELRPERRYRFMPALGHLGCLGGLPFSIEVKIESFTGRVSISVHSSPMCRHYFRLGGYKKHAETFGWVTEDMAATDMDGKMSLEIKEVFRSVGRHYGYLEPRFNYLNDNGPLTAEECDMKAEYHAQRTLENIYDTLNDNLYADDTVLPWIHLLPQD